MIVAPSLVDDDALTLVRFRHYAVGDGWIANAFPLDRR